MMLKCELNARNKITAIGALAVPVLRYSFGIIKWRIEDANKLTAIAAATGKPKTQVKPEAEITVFELLMMGGRTPETC